MTDLRWRERRGAAAAATGFERIIRRETPQGAGGLEGGQPAPGGARADAAAAHLGQPGVDAERVEVEQADRAEVLDDEDRPASVVAGDQGLPVVDPASRHTVRRSVTLAPTLERA